LARISLMRMQNSKERCQRCMQWFDTGVRECPQCAGVLEDRARAFRKEGETLSEKLTNRLGTLFALGALVLTLCLVVAAVL
ncbi:MAG: hypothetical protein AB7V39_20030, partial [Nitrospiraceae bacterium]